MKLPINKATVDQSEVGDQIIKTSESLHTYLRLPRGKPSAA